MLEIESISDVATFEALRPEWTRLLESSRSNCIFLTWEWLYTWWRHLSEGRRLRLLAVRSQGRLIAIAPCALSPRFRFGHALETLEFLGSGYVGSDYLDIIAEQGCEAEAVAALSDYFARHDFALRLSNVRADSLAAEIGDLKAINVCPYVNLEGQNWESYLSSLSAQHRYNFRRKLQKLTREFTVEWNQSLSVDATIGLHNRRWSEKGESDAFHTPELVAFHEEIAPLLFERGWLRLYELRLNGELAACLYGFLYGGKFYFYQSGFDPAYSKYSTGLVAMGLAIRDAIADGAAEFDLLHGNETYKSHWANGSRDLYRLEAFPAGTLGCFSKISVEMMRNARQMALRVLNSGQ